jgi:hypothetical protein
MTDVLVSDLVLYLDHEDPGLRGTAAKLICKVDGACTRFSSHVRKMLTYEVEGRLQGRSYVQSKRS